MLFWILLVALTLLTALSSYVAWRFYRKAVVYDTIITHINDDVIANLLQFDKMAHSVVLSNDNEIKEAHHLMMIMGRRLNEISLQMEEATGIALRPKPRPPRPILK
jgi:hypothetical protein